MARSVLALESIDDQAFANVKRATSRFYFDSIAPRALGHHHAIANINSDHFVLDAESM